MLLHTLGTVRTAERSRDDANLLDNILISDFSSPQLAENCSKEENLTRHTALVTWIEYACAVKLL